MPISGCRSRRQNPFTLCMGRGQAFDKWMEKPMSASEKKTKEPEKEQWKKETVSGSCWKINCSFPLLVLSVELFVLVYCLFPLSIQLDSCTNISSPTFLRTNFKGLSKIYQINHVSFYACSLAFRLCMCQRKKLCLWKEGMLSSKDSTGVLAWLLSGSLISLS